MGANEKHEADHGREYTPTTDDLREIWVDRQLDHLPSEEGIRRVPETQAAFDRWLASVKAQALNDVAGQMRDKFTAAWIRGKAREYTHGPHKIVGAFAKPVESEADCGDQDL